MVYFIQAGEDGPIKIGFAKSVVGIKKRLAGFQTCHAQTLHLLGYVEGSRDEEAEYHALFASSRLRGEWFSPTPHLLQVASDRDWARAELDAFQCRKRLRDWGLVDYHGRLTQQGFEYVATLEYRIVLDGYELENAKDRAEQYVEAVESA